MLKSGPQLHHLCRVLLLIYNSENENCTVRLPQELTVVTIIVTCLGRLRRRKTIPANISSCMFVTKMVPMAMMMTRTTTTKTGYDLWVRVQIVFANTKPYKTANCDSARQRWRWSDVVVYVCECGGGRLQACEHDSVSLACRRRYSMAVSSNYVDCCCCFSLSKSEINQPFCLFTVPLATSSSLMLTLTIRGFFYCFQFQLWPQSFNDQALADKLRATAVNFW